MAKSKGFGCFFWNSSFMSIESETMKGSGYPGFIKFLGFQDVRSSRINETIASSTGGSCKGGGLKVAKVKKPLR